MSVHRGCLPLSRADTPLVRTPPGQTPPRRYTSYWNAFLSIIFSLCPFQVTMFGLFTGLRVTDEELDVRIAALEGTFSL